MPSRIPLFKAKKLGYERDMVSFSIKYGTVPNFLTTAIVDTGCPFIIISQNDIDKTRIPYRNKPSLSKPVSLGNLILELKDLGECEIFFRDYNNQSIKYKERIYVGIPIGLKPGQMLAQQLPSIVGKGFLDNNFLSVIKNKDGTSHLQEAE